MSNIFSTRYFEDDEEESSSNVDLPYIPAENSPTRQQMQSGGGSDSEDDPLDAFMAEVEVRGTKWQRLEVRTPSKNVVYKEILLFVFVPEPSSQRHEENRGKGKGEKISQVRL